MFSFKSSHDLRAIGQQVEIHAKFFKIFKNIYVILCNLIRMFQSPIANFCAFKDKLLNSYFVIAKKPPKLIVLVFD